MTQAPAAASSIVVKPLEIRWHWKSRAVDGTSGNQREEEEFVQRECLQGVMSIDYSPTANRICTSGLDSTIKVWNVPQEGLDEFLTSDTGELMKAVDFVASMSRGDSDPPPNVARWCPNGLVIASAHDGGGVFLWRHDESAPLPEDNANGEQEVWCVLQSYTGHLSDVRDVRFSPDGNYLISGAIDGTVMVHSVENGMQTWRADEPIHNNPCQGVSWDPWNRCVVTAGEDKAVCVFSIVHATERRRFALSHQRQVKAKELGVKFRGQGAASFSRQMSWSPDGTLLVVPCGVAESSDPLRRHCAYVFLRNQLEKPVIRLTVVGKEVIIGAAWCPSFFEPFEDDEDTLHRQAKGMWGSPNYRMALALWSEDAVYVYTTDCAARYCHLTDLHLDSITNVAWSPTGDKLFVCSLDGYVTVAKFRDPIGKPHASLSSFDRSDNAKFVDKIRLDHIRESDAVIKQLLDKANARRHVAVVKKKKKKETPALAAPAAEAAPVAAGEQELEGLL